MKTKHFFCILAVLAVFFSACKPDKEDIPATNVTLNYEELTLVPRDTITLIATVQPDNATNKIVTWTSSNPAVAIVSNEGMVTAIANGEATITATTQDGNKAAACFITVGIPVTGITLNYEELTLIPKDTITLIATVQPDDATNKTVTLTSSNPAVAIVNDNGFVEALANGKATITATTQDGNKKATCEVIVDYRSQWVGDWDFEVIRYWWEGGNSGEDTIYCLGEISYETKSDELCIKYLDKQRVVNVSEQGALSIENGYEHNYVEGEFEGKNMMHVKFYSGGLGGGGGHIIDGTKKERRRK